MAAVDEQQLLHRYCRRWGMTLESGFGKRLTPSAEDEPIFVTGVYLHDPNSAVGQGAVDAGVQSGTREIVLGSLSAENPRVELQTPVKLDEEFLFYVMPLGRDSVANADADADTGAVVVMFEGFFVTPRSLDTEEKEAADDHNDEEYQEEEDDYEDYEEEETDGDHGRYVDRASSAGGISKDVRQVVAISIAFLGILLSFSMLAFLGLIK